MTFASDLRHHLSEQLLEASKARAVVAGYCRDPASLFRAAGVEPDPWQADLLRRWDEPGDVFILGSRQIGKSWAVAALVCLESLLCPGTLTLITGPGERQAKELFARVVGFAVRRLKLTNELPDPGAQEARWTNGSRIVALPGNPQTIRGFSTELGAKNARVRVLIEEASLTNDETYHALRPMLLPVDGRMVALGTPFGKRGFFWETLDASSPGVRSYVLPVSQFPRLVAKRTPDGRSWLDAERERMGPWWFAQEMECVFHEAVGALFTDDMIRRAIDTGVEALWQDARLPAVSDPMIDVTVEAML